MTDGRKTSAYRDADGTPIREGDKLWAGYGIPPVPISGVVGFEGGRWIVHTITSNQKRGYLSDWMDWLPNSYVRGESK